jgi:hypothetical protein
MIHSASGLRRGRREKPRRSLGTLTQGAAVLALLAGARGGDAIGIEGVANPIEAPAIGVQPEDTANEFGLLVVDGELVKLAALRVLAGDLTAVAEHASASGTAARGLAAQAARRRVGDLDDEVAHLAFGDEFEDLL